MSSNKKVWIKNYPVENHSSIIVHIDAKNTDAKVYTLSEYFDISRLSNRIKWRISAATLLLAMVDWLKEKPNWRIINEHSFKKKSILFSNTHQTLWYLFIEDNYEAFSNTLFRWSKSYLINMWRLLFPPSSLLLALWCWYLPLLHTGISILILL